MNAFQKIEQLVTATRRDAEKCYQRNNKSAGIRLRKAYQQLKALAHEGRKEVVSQNKLITKH